MSLIFNDLHKDGGMSSLLFMKVIVINWYYLILISMLGCSKGIIR